MCCFSSPLPSPSGVCRHGRLCLPLRFTPPPCCSRAPAKKWKCDIRIAARPGTPVGLVQRLAPTHAGVPKAGHLLLPPPLLSAGMGVALALALSTIGRKIPTNSRHQQPLFPPRTLPALAARTWCACTPPVAWCVAFRPSGLVHRGTVMDRLHLRLCRTVPIPAGDPTGIPLRTWCAAFPHGGTFACTRPLHCQSPMVGHLHRVAPRHPVDLVRPAAAVGASWCLRA